MDIADVAEVTAAIDEFGERYLARLASDRERHGWPTRTAALSVYAAGVFAAKEAVLKALGGDADRVTWPEIELYQCARGDWEVTLRGAAAVLAEQANMTTVSVSVAMTDIVATAVAIATTM
jgi:holo-[acyl-carrier protein] synthase